MITNPEYLSKDRLKSELKNHGIKFNHNENKQYYVNLYYKNIMQEDNVRGEFSSDEDLSKRVPKQEKKQQVVKKRKSVKVDTYLPSIAKMTDNDLVEELERYGINSGPITDTTRGVYQRKLAKLMSEKATGKSGNVRSVESSDEEQDDGRVSETKQDESYIGEWSSDDNSVSEEDKRIETENKPVDRVLRSGRVRSEAVPRRETGRREARTKEQLPNIPKVKHAKSAHVKQSNGSSSFLCSFLFLILVFAAAFLTYEHYTSEDKPSIVTKSWEKFQDVVFNYMPETVSLPTQDQRPTGEPAAQDQMPTATQEPASQDQPATQEPASQNEPATGEPEDKPSSEPEGAAPSDTVKEPKADKPATPKDSKQTSKGGSKPKVDSKPKDASKPKVNSKPKVTSKPKGASKSSSPPPK